MRPISQKLRKQIDEDPFYRKCVREAEGNCNGRITIEHALLFGGRQVDELFALIPLCWEHHLGKGLCKRYNQYIALKRATEEDFRKYAKANWKRLLEYLTSLFEEKQAHIS